MTHVPFKRLVIFISSMSGGGAERVTANLANHWAGKGWEITVVTLAPRSLDFYELHPSVKRIALNLSGESANILIGLWQNLRRVIALRRVLQKIQPDIALAMMSSANILMAFAALGLHGVVAIGSEHIHPPKFPLGRLWEWLRTLAYGHLAAVTALTEESATWLRKHTHARCVPVIPNAVPWPLTSQEPVINPDRILPPKSRVLLAAGRLDKQKGFDLLIEAFSAIALTHPDWVLVILGAGPERAALEAQIHYHASGLTNRIFLPGRVGNVGQWYEAADLFVMSSRFEGFGNTLAEAMAYGLPAISFDCPSGPREIIRDGVDGILVPPENADALAEAMDRLMSDEAERKRLAAKAQEVLERFGLDKIMGMWEDLIQGLIKE